MYTIKTFFFKFFWHNVNMPVVNVLNYIFRTPTVCTSSKNKLRLNERSLTHVYVVISTIKLVCGLYLFEAILRC